jgi:hypothetical protein
MQNVFSVGTCSSRHINHGFEDGLLFILILFCIPSGHIRISVLSLPHPYLVTPSLRYRCMVDSTDSINQPIVQLCLVAFPLLQFVNKHGKEKALFWDVTPCGS